ncbi:MAG TPA: hypothetical protein VFS95_06280 [Telluria sp.]|nr:hypothetical protein [Telluria sp.]
MKKSVSFLTAAIALAAPLAVHAAGIDFKQIVKDSVKAGTQQPAANNGNANQPLPEPGQAGNVAVPKVLETMGVKIGDTPQQVDKVLTAQGYKKYDTTNHLLGMHFQGILWSTKYVKKSGKNSPYWNDPMIDVRYGPQSGKVLAIRRTEKFETPVVGSVIKQALTEKYGTPTSGRYEDVNWVAYRPGFSYGIKDSDRDECTARGNVNLNGSPDRGKFKDCRVAVGVRLGDIVNGKEYGSIEVMITDFTTSEAEFAVAYAAMKQKDAEELEEHKKRPVPKL